MLPMTSPALIGGVLAVRYGGELLQLVDLQVFGECGDKVVFGGQHDLVRVCGQADVDLRDLLPLLGQRFGDKVLKAPVEQTVGFGKALGDSRTVRRVRAAEQDRIQLGPALFRIGNPGSYQPARCDRF